MIEYHVLQNRVLESIIDSRVVGKRKGKRIRKKRETVGTFRYIFGGE